MPVTPLEQDHASATERGSAVFGALLIAWGLFVIIGLSTFRQAFVESLPGIDRIALETCLSFILAGAGLLAGLRDSAAWLRGQAILGGTVALIALLVLGRYLSGFPFPFGADFASAAPFDNPGSMLPTTAVALLAGGLVLAVVRRETGVRSGIALQLLLLLLLLLTLVGNVGHLLNRIIGTDIFGFGIGQYTLGWGSAVGLLLFCLGSLLAAKHAPWLRAFYAGRPDREVFAIGTTMLLVGVIIAGMLGAGILTAQTVALLKESLKETLLANSRIIVASIKNDVDEAGDIVRLSGLDKLVRRDPANGVDAARIQAELERIRQTQGGGNRQVSAMWLVDSQGREIAAVGRRTADGENRVRLRMPERAWLFWHDGFRVEVRIPIMEGSRQLGEFAAEFYLEEVSKRLDLSKGLGASVEVRICALRGQMMDCYPSRLSHKTQRIPTHLRGQALPMSYALAGQEGVIFSHDYRDQSVIASYMPLSDFGLGIVQKIDTDEFYSSTRHQIWMSVLFLGMLVLAGSGILFFRVRPTVSRLNIAGARLREAQRIAHMGSWEWDISSGAIFWSDESFRIFGLDPGSVTSSYEFLLSLVHPDDRDKVEARDLNTLETGDPYCAEYRILRPNGEVRHVLGQAELLRDREGKPERVVGTNLDITERVKTARQLSQVSRLYAVLSKANQAIVRARDADELLAKICRIAVEDGGFSMACVGELENDRVVLAHYGKDDRSREQAANIAGDGWSGICFGGSNVPEEKCFISDDIATDPCVECWHAGALERGYRSVAAYPIRKAGKVYGALTLYAPEPHIFSPEVVELLEDLTADISFALDAFRESGLRRQAEESLNKLNEELEWRVAERTHQVEAANRELESFSYSVSHDLRAPLRSIQGFSQILLKRYAERLDETGKDYLDRVRRASQRMGELIDDLLQLARISRGALRRQETDLSDIARAVVEELRRNEPERRVLCDIQEGMRAFGDAGLMRVVLDNLIGNAWKFTRYTSDAQIVVGSGNRDGEMVYFVRDNGAGFDSAYSKKLFQAFQRLHLESEFEGTGIGLATVQRVIARHKGRVWAEGEPGNGATFWFIVPRRRGRRED